MDFIDQLKQFATRAEQLSKVITTEEATKNALILPFFQLLGYDVFNPMEFVPEYTADVGIKKGEKVDYAIVIDGTPTILIEAKWCGEKLESHDSQLFRYFGTTTAKFGILTNGLLYRFYTDLDEENKMDLTPFMEFNILDIKDALVPELKRFNHDTLNIDDIFGAASDLKYTTAVKQLIAAQATDPDEAFLSFVIKEVYPGRRTAQIAEKFKTIVKRSFAQYLNDLMNEKFKSIMSAEPKPDIAQADTAAPAPESATDAPVSAIITTAEEMESYVVIKALLHGVVDPARIQFKDTQSYFGILLDGKTTQWICRLKIEGKRKSIIYPGLSGIKEERIHLDGLNDLYAQQDRLTAIVNAYLQAKA